MLMLLGCSGGAFEIAEPPPAPPPMRSWTERTTVVAPGEGPEAVLRSAGVPAADRPALVERIRSAGTLWSGDVVVTRLREEPPVLVGLSWTRGERTRLDLEWTPGGMVERTIRSAP